jgi:hypothetical protein
MKPNLVTRFEQNTKPSIYSLGDVKVIINEGDTVIKKTNDGAWIIWAQWAINQNNKHIPTFIDHIKYDEYYYFEYEKLNLNHRHYNTPSYPYSCVQTWEAIHEKLNKANHDETIFALFKKIYDQFSPLIETYGLLFDIHDGNIMQRENGAAAVIDPLYVSHGPLRPFEDVQSIHISSYQRGYNDGYDKCAERYSSINGIPKKSIRAAIRYIEWCGANQTEKGLPHPQELLLNDLKKLLAETHDIDDAIQNLKEKVKDLERYKKAAEHHKFMLMSESNGRHTFHDTSTLYTMLQKDITRSITESIELQIENEELKKQLAELKAKNNA